MGKRSRRKPGFTSKYYEYLRAAVIDTAMAVLFLVALLWPPRAADTTPSANNHVVSGYEVFVNGASVGFVGEIGDATAALQEARRAVARSSEELVFAQAQMDVNPKDIMITDVTDAETLKAHMQEAFVQEGDENLNRAYALKVNDYMVNLSGLDEVYEVLQAAVSKYDSSGRFQVRFEYAPNRELNVLTASIVDIYEEQKQEESAEIRPVTDSGRGGLWSLIGDTESAPEPVERSFEDYETGITEMSFAQEVEITEVYIPDDRISPKSEPIADLVEEQQVPSVYTVEPGDTLSGIALKVNIPMDTIVAMNDSLEDVNSIIHVDQSLVITIPEPALSVNYTEEVYVEEVYESDIVYIDNDSWYTTKRVTVQDPVAGFRKAVKQITHHNASVTGTEVLKEEVVMEPVAKVIERGTLNPPTYIKPISGGRLTSKFGYRKSPKKGASTYHQGIDLGTPVGTSVKASRGGTVSKAGWVSGYGYAVYIDHPDGVQTRYGHLSKVKVKVGQKVSQGQQIALSGNSGVSTGPHLHFEVVVGGKRVDPLKYIKL